MQGWRWSCSHTHTHTLRNDDQASQTCISVVSHTLTDRGQSTGRPGADSGSRRGTWVCQGGGSPLRPSLLPRPSSSSSCCPCCPCCPWRNPRSLSARRAGPRRGRAAGPRTAAAGRSNVAASLTERHEETQRGSTAESVVYCTSM